MLKKINKATSSIAENGLHQFYDSFIAFQRNFIERDHLKQQDEDIQALTVEQLRRPMILVFFLWGVAIVIRIAEIIAIKWRHWRNHQIGISKDVQAAHLPTAHQTTIIVRPHTV